GVELPDQGAEAVAEFGDAADEILYLRSGAVQRTRPGDALGRLGGEYEARRRFVAPFGVRGRLLRAVPGAVDLDRRQLAARVLEFAALDQARRVEAAAPGCVGPAADADPDAVDRGHA